MKKSTFLISTGLLASFYQLIIQGYTQQAQLRLRVQQQLKHRSVRHWNYQQMVELIQRHQVIRKILPAHLIQGINQIILRLPLGLLMNQVLLQSRQQNYWKLALKRSL